MLGYPHLRHLPRFRLLRHTNPAPQMPLASPSIISSSLSQNYGISPVSMSFPGSSLQTQADDLDALSILLEFYSAQDPQTTLHVSSLTSVSSRNNPDSLSDPEQITPPTHSPRAKLYEPFSQLLPAMPVVVNNSSLTPESFHGNTSPSMTPSQAHVMKTTLEAQNKAPRLDLS